MTEDIKQIVDEFIRISETRNNLLNSILPKVENVCRVIDPHSKLGYVGLDYIDKDTVCCKEHYQGCDEDEFSFPTKLLFCSDEEILEYKEEEKKRREDKETEDKIKRQEEQIAKEKETLERLKKKYEVK